MAGEALSQGTIFRIQTGIGPIVYTAIEKVVGWPGFGDAREFEDITSLESTATEKLAKLPVSGSSAFDIIGVKGASGILLAAGQQAALDAYESGATLSFEVEFPAAIGGQTFTRNGIVTQFEMVANTNSAIRIAMTVEWTGAWSLA